MSDRAIKELTEEIRKLREELRESRFAAPYQVRFVPQPVYVPVYPQPSFTPWWGTITVSPGTWKIANTTAGNYEPSVTTTSHACLSSGAQISLT